MRSFVMFVALSAPLTACLDADDEFPLDEEASAKADGTPWYKVYTCNGGQAVLDVNGNERRNLQFVIRDPNVMKFFHDKGVVSLPYGATELILSGWTGYIDWNGPFGPILHYQPYGGRGVFDRSDFRADNELIANKNYYAYSDTFVRVFPDSGGIKVQAGQINPTWCGRTETYCPGDGYDCSTSCVEQHYEFVAKADWFFNSCY